MYITLNEVTVNGAFYLCEDGTNAEGCINEIVKFIKTIKDSNVEGIILSMDMYSWIISVHYNLNEWFSDRNIPREYKQFLRVYLGKYTQLVEKTGDLCELKFILDSTEYVSDGALVAAKNSHPLLSIATKKPWIDNILTGVLYEIDEDGNDGTCQVELRNVSLISTSSDIKKIVGDIEYESISSGYDLWAQREKIFPNLVFCESVKDQLYNDPERFHIIRVMERLNLLDKYFSSCDSHYDPISIGTNARTESETVKTNPRLKELRKFRLPSCEERYFFDHISFTGKYTGGRIHFLPDCPNRKCYIGYIGRHLPTSIF